MKQNLFRALWRAVNIALVASLVALSFLVLLIPKIYQQSAGVAFGALAKVLGF